MVLLSMMACLEPAPALEPTGTATTVYAPCSPLTCTGCCAEGVCLGGNADDACGYDGRGCNTCPSTHHCESPGACYPNPMPRESHDETVPPDAHCRTVNGMIRCL